MKFGNVVIFGNIAAFMMYGEAYIDIILFEISGTETQSGT
jgi:hypothetical protein